MGSRSDKTGRWVTAIAIGMCQRFRKRFRKKGFEKRFRKKGFEKKVSKKASEKGFEKASFAIAITFRSLLLVRSRINAEITTTILTRPA